MAAGADYLDSSGEQAWARLLFERFREAETAILPCFGFDYVPGDVAARLAAEGLEPLDEIVVAYSATAAATSRGTRRTVGEIVGQPVVAWHEGRLVPSRLGATTRTIVFPFGAREVVEFGGAEPLTVPRHTDVRTVRAYMRLAKPAAKAARSAALLAPLIRTSAGLRGIGPEPGKSAATRFVVVAEARGPQGGRRVTLAGSDPYLLTARLHGRRRPARAASHRRARARRGIRRRGPGRGRRRSAADRVDRDALAGPVRPVLRLSCGGMRLRPLSEEECYARCYGGWEPTVKVVRLEPRTPHYELEVTGEELRRQLEVRIDSREPEAPAEAA